MALLTFTMMFATQDRSISRLFLGTFLVWSWLGLAVLNAWLPRQLARLVFQRGHRLPTVRALAQELGIANNTVARAYRELEVAGAIETRGRAGSFVTGDAVTISSDGFHRIVGRATIDIIKTGIAHRLTL